MKCIHCGKEIAEGAKFCLNCGAKIADMVTENVPAPEVPAEPPKAEIPEEVKPAFCAKCGSPLAEGQKFCLKCGAAADGKAKAAKSGKGIDKKWLIIGGCALAAIILMIVLIVALAGGGVGSNGASSPEAVGEACYETQIDGDAEGYYGLFCTPVLRDKSGMGEEASREDMIKYLAEKYGSSMSGAAEMIAYGVSVDVKGAEAETGYSVSDYKFRSFTEEERAKVEDVARVTVTMQYSYSGFSQTDDEDIYCVKIDGKWFLLDD